MHEVGELRVKNKYVAVSCISKSEKLVDSFDNDGFYKTGDLGCYDNYLDVYYKDRMKALIKYMILSIKRNPKLIFYMYIYKEFDARNMPLLKVQQQSHISNRNRKYFA